MYLWVAEEKPTKLQRGKYSLPLLFLIREKNSSYSEKEEINMMTFLKKYVRALAYDAIFGAWILTTAKFFNYAVDSVEECADFTVNNWFEKPETEEEEEEDEKTYC